MAYLPFNLCDFLLAQLDYIPVFVTFSIINLPALESLIRQARVGEEKNFTISDTLHDVIDTFVMTNIYRYLLTHISTRRPFKFRSPEVTLPLSMRKQILPGC